MYILYLLPPWIIFRCRQISLGSIANRTSMSLVSKPQLCEWFDEKLLRRLPSHDRASISFLPLVQSIVDEAELQLLMPAISHYCYLKK